MARPEQSSGAAGAPALLAKDPTPPTLTPVFQAIAREFVPLRQGINEKVRAKLGSWPPGQRLPRRLDDVEVPMGPGRLRRVALPYSLWMAQRTLDF